MTVFGKFTEKTPLSNTKNIPLGMRFSKASVRPQTKGKWLLATCGF